MTQETGPAERKRFTRIIIASNRLPIYLTKVGGKQTIKRSSGGLVTAIEPIQAKHKLLWVGAIGGAAPSGEKAKLLAKELRSEFSYKPIFLTRTEWKCYYEGFSNAALWPLFHYFSENCRFEEKEWDVYCRVNMKFADVLLKSATADDLIWIHDFHLLLVPQLVRERMPEARIGFFLHTPFPSSEIFRILPWRRKILQGMLGADLLAFHTFDYVRHFRSSALRILGIESDMTSITQGGRSVALAAIPVGADSARIQQVLAGLVVKGAGNKPKSAKKMKMMLGVDRLDYTKGLVNRFEAYRKFLSSHPKWRGQVEFLQILVPSRTEIATYKKLKRRIDELVGSINAQFGRTDWVPIRCFYRQVDIRQLVRFYTQADVAMVTPLRDGMNLVAKEFLLAQDPGDPGVLVLSEFCGAASELSDALMVNPWNETGMVQMIHRSLEMSQEEKTRRYQVMIEQLRRFSAENWGVRFIGELESVTSVRQTSVPVLRIEMQQRLKREWTRSAKRLVCLDYDGTLVDLVGVPDKAVPTEQIRGLLRALVSDRKNLVVVVSGRPRDLLFHWLGETGCCLAAEHGAWIWDGKSWNQTYEATGVDWKGNIRPIMELYTTRTPGSLIEEKEEALAWHYRMCEPEFGFFQARDLAINLEELIKGLPLQYILGKKVVEVRHRDVNKGAAWEWLKKSGRRFDFEVAIGDDRTDEDLFRVMPKEAWSIHVGVRDSAARYRIDSPKQVLELLSFLTEDSGADRGKGRFAGAPSLVSENTFDKKGGK